MAENTHIEWATHTFNPWEGCTKVSAGCKNCYAETRNHRYGMDNWGKGKPRRRTSEANWKLPLHWNKRAEQDMVSYRHELHKHEYDLKHPRPIKPERPRVFCASLADVFDEEVPDEWRDDLFSLIYQTPHLDWLLLTKRPERIRPLLDESYEAACWKRSNSNEMHGLATWLGNWLNGFAPKNVWLGTSVENQQAADDRIPALLEIPAAVRFLSCEPLLGAVDLNEYLGCGWDGEGGWRNCPQHLAGKIDCSGVDWCIVGGESGSNARPCDLAWIRSLVEQCYDADVPCFVKQLGKEVIVNSRDARRIDDREQNRARLFQGANDGDVWHWNPRDKKGGDIEEFPEDLQVREFPEVLEREA